MPHAKLRITVPKAVWIGEITRTYPKTRFQIIAATADESSGVARVDILGPGAEAACEEIQQAEAVTNLTIFEAESTRRTVQIETTVPLLMQSIEASGVPLDLPVDIVDGELVLELTVPQPTLSTLGVKLDEFGIPYTVEWIKQDVETDPLLTDRQEWLLREAIDHGYYDTPRRTSLVDLADDLDIAKSTCSEMLHRVEERILKDYLTEELETGPNLAASAD